MSTARRIADTDSEDIGVTEPSRGVEGHEGDPGAPPTGMADVLSPDERWAEHLRSTVPALFMHTSMIKPFPDASPVAYKKYRERVLADSGSPQDAVETMLLDQLALANFNVGLLQCRAANAAHVADAGVYAQAAARLMGEFRRSAWRCRPTGPKRGNWPRSRGMASCCPIRASATRVNRRKKSAPAKWNVSRGRTMESTRSSRCPGPGQPESRPRKHSVEGVERLRAAALANRPWERTRGPITPEGKARSRENGRSRQRGKSRRQMQAELAHVLALIRQMQATRRSLM